MTLWVAQPCGCSQEVAMGQRRERVCGCGHLFERPEVIEARREKARTAAAKPAPVRPIAECSPAQREKVRGGPCIGCGRVVEPDEETPWTIDPMHVWPQGKGGCMDPDCVLPGCRHRFTGEGCHRLFDEGKLDLLSRLSASPEAFAVELAHPILRHGVTLVELARRLAGNQEELVWIAREAAA